MSWIYKRYIAKKLSEIIIPSIFDYIEIDEKKIENESIQKNNLVFSITENDKLKIFKFIENCIERVKPLSKSKAKGNKKRKLNNGKEFQKHDSQLSILMPRLSKELLQWYYQSLISLKLIPESTNFKSFIFKKNLVDWCNDLKNNFPENEYIPTIISSGIYLNFVLSKAGFLKLQLFTIPFILSKSDEFMSEQKIILNEKNLIHSDTTNDKIKNIAIYYTPVELQQILSSSSSKNIGLTAESMTNHVKSLILSNFIAKLYLYKSDITNYLKFNTINLNENNLNNSIFITRYVEDIHTIAKLIYANKKYDNKLSHIIKNCKDNLDNNQDIINEIYKIMELIDEELKKQNDNTILNEIKEIESYLEKNYQFFFDQKSTEIKNSNDKDMKLIIQVIRSILSKRYFNGVQRFIPNHDDNKYLSLEIYNELIFQHSKNSILTDSNNINISNLFKDKLAEESNNNNLILYWIFGHMYEQNIFYYEDEENKILKLDVNYEKKSIIEKGKKIINLIKESLVNIYINLESIDFSHNKTQKFVPIIKNIKQGKIYLKINKKDINNENNEILNNEKVSDFYSDLVLIIKRVFNISQQKPIHKLIFVNNINKEHHYMQLIALLEWIQFSLMNEGKKLNEPNIIKLDLGDSIKTIIKAYIGTEWEIISHGRIDNLWDLSILDSLNISPNNKITLDLNYLIDSSKIEMSEVIESNIEKYRDMEKELINDNKLEDKGFSCVRSVDDIVEVSGISSIILQNLQYRRMKNYKYEWTTSSSANDDDDDSFDDFDDFSNNKKSNIGLYLQYIYAKICGILRNCDFNEKQKEFQGVINEKNEKKMNDNNQLFSMNKDIFSNIEDFENKYISNNINSIFDFEELVRVTPEVFSIMWFIDDYIYNIYPSVCQKIEPSLILDALNHISHSISSASSDLRVKGLGKSKLSNEIKALDSRKRSRVDENESNDIENNDQYWEVLANTRLLLFSFIRKLLYHGLSVLGVQPLDRM
ncbi:hypothetical protein BCR32DRAFT_266893 [Anaeromyces robustus]|uniref:DALR anticodon binding domain-containing protein n=1 Tax=Anaeromyces robustus TaxID=1754192 RepID=A0A1Y1XCT3_9FUNG|nr:hypothetical protein BCR32DRAFT_266893 [Anaeromyces robustus]|eukprot:ORX83601.1 hypothetical protein BCR32DRAFT_266893 [Anaeromyces robustus]